MKLRNPPLGLALSLVTLAASAFAAPLGTYVARSDAAYSWKQLSQRQADGLALVHLELVSQRWRDFIWTHDVRVVRPEKLRNPHIALLYIAGDGDGSDHVHTLQRLGARAGAIAAVVTNIPNQPLYDGRSEDALIAYTLDQYLRTGDDTWPLLFPMVKSVVRAMDALQTYAHEQHDQEIEGFVVTGASKRGWTAWLTAASDSRIRGVAPMVIDMLNIKAQTNWAQKVYGRQSEKIHDYVDLGLVKENETEDMSELRSWIDPYTYRERFQMPKLLLLGTNDPYWTVDSLRHYWNDLPEPKLVFQTPNAGHDLAGGEDAMQSLAAFFQIIADAEELPTMDWAFTEASQDKGQVVVSVDYPARHVDLWTAESNDRDFRDATWTSRRLNTMSGSTQASVEIPVPREGYRAFLIEAVLTSPTGHAYKISTPVKVIPDNIR